MCTSNYPPINANTPSRKKNQLKRNNISHSYDETPTTKCSESQIKQQSDHRQCLNLVIVGDSMIKHIVPGKLHQWLKTGFIFRTFPEGKKEYMKHYLQPTLKAKLANLIVRVGTNDLDRESPEETAQVFQSWGKLQLSTSLVTTSVYQKV